MTGSTDDGQGGSTPVRRRRRALRNVLIGVVVLGVAAGGAVYLTQEATPPEGCKVTTAAGAGTLELDQAANAATITAVAVSRGLPERAVTIALATAMQESKLRNLSGGDRDSVGLFQQRPSQGWGTAEQIQDPVYATSKFLDALVKVQGYARMPLTDAAQAVQKSGYPQAYAKHEGDATLVASALDGREPAALTCVVHDLTTPTADASPAPAQPAAALTERVKREFKQAVTVTPAPAGKDQRPVLALVAQPTASADSGAGGQRQAGWAVAQWAVAQANYLGIGEVSFDGRVWRQDKPRDGWKAQPGGSGADRVLITLGAPVKK